MNKYTIKVRKGIKYISEIKDVEIMQDSKCVGKIEDFEFMPGVLNKGVPDCGGTTHAIRDEKNKTIICSPRNELLKNKMAQHPECLLVIGGVKPEDVIEYLKSVEVPKILVSYDSLYKLLDCIEDKSEWKVIVDEFQCILSDAGFKSEVELRFLDKLKEFPCVTFLSATPILDKYLEMIDYFKDMDYYELDWEDKEVTKVYRYKSPNPIAGAVSFINNYQAGHLPSLTIDDKVVKSEECVVFLNSVTNIVNIIKQTELKPEEVNIIIGNSPENDKLIAKLGEGYSRGRIPLKGEVHKKFTLASSTAYAGCDFYSTNATTIAVSDCKRINTAIDIATELVQIAGRQRLAENHFRKYIVFIYNTSMDEVSDEEFEEELKDKVNLTWAEINSNNSEENLQLKAKRVTDSLREQRALKYGSSFTLYDLEKEKFVFNRLAYINEIYSRDLQKHNYENGIIVKKQLAEHGMDVSENQEYVIFEEQLKHLITNESFVDRMKYYCEYRSKKGLVYDLNAQILEEKYPELKYYYEELGAGRIKALSYKECDLKREVTAVKSINQIRCEFYKEFKVGDKLTNADAKSRIQAIYNKLGLEKKKAKATDLGLFFEVKDCKVRVSEKRKNGLEIVLVK